MADVTFRRGVEANLPTSGMATEGCVYQSTDTGNMYVGSSQGTLIPVNRSPYYGTCQTQAGTNAKVVTLDVDEDNFTMKAGVMISVMFSNANTAASPTLNVNGKGAVTVKVYGTTNVSASPRAWEAGEVVTFVHNGSYWMMVGHKVQSDWNQTDTAAEDFIKNKPTVPTINEALSANYGVCSSSASTVAKTVTVNNSDFTLSEGVRVKVKFNRTNYADAPTLSVNGTAAKPIVTKGTNGVGRGATSSWSGGSVVELTYDGTSWVIDGWLNDNDVYHAGGSNVTVEDLDPFEEYDSLNSISNSSSTSFSTGLIPSNQNEVFIDIRYYERSSLTNFYLFGYVGGTAVQYRYGLVQPTSTSTAKFHLCWRDKGNAYLESTVARVASHLYRIKARLHNGTATLYVLDETTGVSDTVTATYDTTNVNTIAGNLRLFAGGSSNYYCGSSTNIYFARMDCDGKSLLNYIPMRRKSDEMVGFLDTVSDSFLSSASGNVAADKLNAGSLIDRPDNHIIKVSSTVDDSNFVHKTGAETVGGEKTFTDNLKIGAGKVIDLGVGNDEGVYIQSSSDSNGKQIAFGDDSDDSEVRLVNVAAPIDGLDAANKAYVDAAIEGGSSGITLPLAINQGGTGRTTAKGAEFAMTTNLGTELTTDIDDSYRIPFVGNSPSATNGRYGGFRQAFRLWDYILGKITSLLGISYNSNDEGVPLAPTAAAGTNTTQIATTAFVNTATSGLAIDNNVVHKSNQEHIVGYKYFDGGFESSYIAKTNGTSSQFLKADGSVDSNAYITSADIPNPSSSAPLMDGQASAGNVNEYSRRDHVHPSDTSRVPTTRKVNNKPLSSDITLNASDVGALPSNTFIPNDSNLVHKTGNENIGGTKTFNNNVVLSSSANLYFGTGQDEGVYVEAWDDGSGGQSLMFASLDDDSEVKLENIATPVYNTDAANKQYVDDASKNNSVSLNGRSGTYGLPIKSLVVCAEYVNGMTWLIEPLTKSGGLGTKEVNSSAKFPIGSKIYYHPDNTAFNANTDFVSKMFYSTFNSVDARYSANNGESLSLSSSSMSNVYLRVVASVSESTWNVYNKGNIIVTSGNLSQGGFYIYLGKTNGNTGYSFQLEDNNPLYYYDGGKLVDWATYIAEFYGGNYTAGNGISINGGEISISPDTALNVNSTNAVTNAAVYAAIEKITPKAWRSEILLTGYFNSKKTMQMSSSSNPFSSKGTYKVSADFLFNGGINGTYGTGATQAYISLSAFKDGGSIATELKSAFIRFGSYGSCTQYIHIEDYVYLSTGVLVPQLVIEPVDGYVSVVRTWYSGTDYNAVPTFSVEYLGDVTLNIPTLSIT